MAKRRVLPLLLGLVAFVLASASVPHIHAGAGLGLWNGEHDLTLMAAFGTHACQLETIPVLGLALTLKATIVPAAVRVASIPLCRSDSRAPPLS